MTLSWHATHDLLRFQSCFHSCVPDSLRASAGIATLSAPGAAEVATAAALGVAAAPGWPGTCLELASCCCCGKQTPVEPVSSRPASHAATGQTVGVSGDYLATQVQPFLEQKRFRAIICWWHAAPCRAAPVSLHVSDS
jgi:hypothetical protein